MATIQLQVQDETKGFTNYIVRNILECVTFWNKNGEKEFPKDGVGEGREFDDYLLERLLIDCRTFCNSDFAKNSGDKYECGRTRGHVWVHLNDNRILMFHC